MIPRVILTTGANQGIGYCIVQTLAEQKPENIYLLGVRSLTAGEDAIKKIQALGISAQLECVQLDITKDDQIQAAVELIKQKYGKLDILINNAGIAMIPRADLDDFRSVYSQIHEVNVTSTGLVTNRFLPLLRASSDARVINVSSSRGSIGRAMSGSSPPVGSIPYSISKVALNMMIYEMAKVNPDVLFQLVCPGHCHTAFNGYRGQRDPMDGAKVVVELACCNREAYPFSFWEYQDDKMGQVPW